MNFIPLIPDSKVAVIRDKEGFFAFIKRDDATDELISRAEETMGYKLPESYKELLRFRNGGSINGDLEECWLTEIYGIAADPDNFNGLEAMYDNWRNEWEYPDMTYHIEKTKSSSGTRVIPMTPDVREHFEAIIKKRRKVQKEMMVDGVSGFLYLDDQGRPLVAYHWQKRFNHAVHRHNQIYKEQLPNITPHVCRHTYCSNMAKSGMNPKTLQYLMGHSDIGVTMNTYTHLGLDDAVMEIHRLQEQERVLGEFEEEEKGTILKMAE